MNLKPHGMDFSEDGKFPAVIEVVLGTGSKFKCAATDSEAVAIIRQLERSILRYEAEYARTHDT